MELDLTGFTGTEHYYRLTNRAVLTDGTAYLAREGRCFWLMDVIASYIPTLPSDEHFAIAVFKRKGAGGHFELVDDIRPRRYYATQEIEYTDFPLNEIRLYVERLDDEQWVILLPSEH